MIQDKLGVLLVVNIINGNMRTPKINALYRMIDWLNAKGDNITKLPLDLSPIESNAWLSGFIDADGHFAIKGSKRTYIAFQFYLCQREVDKSGESFEPLFKKIGEYLLTKVILTKKNNFPQFTITTSNKISNYIIINYLTTYPLFSSKYNDFIDWSNTYEYFHSKQHIKDPKIKDYILKVKSEMNKGRVKFTWQHLDNFYKY